MNQEDKRSICAVIIIIYFLAFLSSFIIYDAVFKQGYLEGVESVDIDTRTYDITYSGGYVNNSVYNSTYYQIYTVADLYPPPILHDDSFIISVHIESHYENSSMAPFSVKVFDDPLSPISETGLAIDLVATQAHRQNGYVGLFFNLENLTAMTSFAYGFMDVYFFGHGLVPHIHGFLTSHLLTIGPWEGDK